MSSSDSDNDFELLKDQVKTVKASARGYISNRLTMNEKLQTFKNGTLDLTAKDPEIEELEDMIESLEVESKGTTVEKKILVTEDPNKDQKLLIAEEQIRALSLENQELKAKENAKDLEIAKLKATIEKLKEENSGNPIIKEIVGSWQPNSPIALNLQMKEFPDEKRQRFETLLKAETKDNVAKYEVHNGLIYFYATLRTRTDFDTFGVFKHKTWTSKLTFADGQTGEIERSMEGGLMKMVLKSNGDEMTIKWQRITA